MITYCDIQSGGRMNSLDLETANKLFFYEEETGKLIRKITTSPRAKAGDEAGCVVTHNGKKYRQV
jgi:hypothetical protein